MQRPVLNFMSKLANDLEILHSCLGVLVFGMVYILYHIT